MVTVDELLIIEMFLKSFFFYSLGIFFQFELFL